MLRPVAQAREQRFRERHLHWVRSKLPATSTPVEGPASPLHRPPRRRPRSRPCPQCEGAGVVAPAGSERPNRRGAYELGGVVDCGSAKQRPGRRVASDTARGVPWPSVMRGCSLPGAVDRERPSPRSSSLLVSGVLMSPDDRGVRRDQPVHFRPSLSPGHHLGVLAAVGYLTVVSGVVLGPLPQALATGALSSPRSFGSRPVEGEVLARLS